MPLLGQTPEQPLLSTQRPSLWSLGTTHCPPPPALAPPGQGHSYASPFWSQGWTTEAPGAALERREGTRTPWRRRLDRTRLPSP